MKTLLLTFRNAERPSVYPNMLQFTNLSTSMYESGTNPHLLPSNSTWVSQESHHPPWAFGLHRTSISPFQKPIPPPFLGA